MLHSGSAYLSVINVTNRADVDVWLVASEGCRIAAYSKSELLLLAPRAQSVQRVCSAQGTGSPEDATSERHY